MAPKKLSTAKLAQIAELDQVAAEQQSIAELSDLCRTQFGLAAKARELITWHGRHVGTLAGPSRGEAGQI